MIQTWYWHKINWKSKYIFVAPHWAWDDINTDKLCELLAINLDWYAIINNKFFKFNNKHNKDKNLEEDFNRLPYNWDLWAYQWQSKKPEMKDFWSQIDTYSEEIRKNLSTSPIIVHIHWMKTNWISQIDIWTWEFYFKYNENSKIKKILWNTRLSQELAKKLQINLDKKLWNNQNSTINQLFTWAFKSFGIQYWKTYDITFQLEIAYDLRKDIKKLEKTTKIISDSLLLTF